MAPKSTSTTVALRSAKMMAELSGIVLIFRDIGEKRRLEKEREEILLELRSRYAELEATYQNAAIAMALIDAVEFRYVRVNRKLCELLGLPEEKVLGSKVSEVAAGGSGASGGTSSRSCRSVRHWRNA